MFDSLPNFWDVAESLSVVMRTFTIINTAYKIPESNFTSISKTLQTPICDIYETVKGNQLI